MSEKKVRKEMVNVLVLDGYSKANAMEQVEYYLLGIHDHRMGDRELYLCREVEYELGIAS